MNSAGGAPDDGPHRPRPRVGLLGTGPWARRTHAPALAAHTGSEFAGVWGRRPEAAAELADAYGVKVYEDPDALFADCDVAAFALPPDIQAPLAVRAAAAGCHLLLDKPVATTVEDARAVADAAAAHGVASVVFLTLRFAEPTAGWVREQAGRSGWFTASAHWLGAVFPPDGEPSAYADSPWRKAKGGLWDVGPHALSVLIPVLGEVTAVTATAGPSDVVQLALRHASGAASTAVLSLGAPRAAAGVGLELRGAEGVFSLPDWSDVPGAYGRALDALLDAARTGVPDPRGAEFGARLTEILAQAEGQLG
ncbi:MULTISPECIES: Gfo/Idh/MocA family protein [Streptomyces]|uniref:Gfo/Idh/MocA family oxidoreductase n=1 Tax=Streptomyces katrae TaxID=68223 RepID=A0ABT7GYD9_9ACTN|nr:MULTISPECIES: Gfo/Idh/MocA family oxidoreductase [Streptomyces]MDK9498254.1 Gfo/Idh/MocA family oxidoreductase [Streptomyces katrae]RSS99322.1 gfo/Idh/MocA family oxidoreductase [Streptomyces sp. WAC07149]GLX31251.1 oxidoreductase [Streptomyces lavendulae subsp. lavendulae]